MSERKPLQPGNVLVPANFDPDLSPESETNRRAARARGLTYDARSRVYRDEDGCPTRDAFGQPLG